MTTTIEWKDVDDEMPDADLTVLVFCPQSDDPVWIGYWDGETWRGVDGGELGQTLVSAWADMPEAPTRRGNGRRRASEPNAVRALETVERLLRNQPAYGLAVDRSGRMSLGSWIRRAIRVCKGAK